MTDSRPAASEVGDRATPALSARPRPDAVGVVYRRLDGGRIAATLELLSRRIAERFPDSGLYRVSLEMLEVAREARANVEFLRRPYWPVRVAALSFVTLLVGTLAATILVAISFLFAARAQPLTFAQGVSDTLQGVEALVNDIVFIGIGIWFVMTIETRLKRRRALRAIHELRSFAHIVDMHQLTKDPERFITRQQNTASSPVRVLNRAQLGRYLDYCSELLSVLSKLAALYVQDMNDPVVLGAVSEVETLSGGLSGKIWQKITLLNDGPDG